MNIAERLTQVENEIDAACNEAKRNRSSVTLVAVSKTFGADVVEQVIDSGQRVFGENRVQEAQNKWPDLRKRAEGIELHLIGPLQSNKAGDAVSLFDVIETVDREKIAKALSIEMRKQNRQLKLYVQVNTGSEPQKAGVSPEHLVEFVDKCQREFGLVIEGLMCIPPIAENPGPHFSLLAKLAEESGVQELSMGMSADYQTAIAFGATSVRVGSAIFGVRETNKA